MPHSWKPCVRAIGGVADLANCRAVFTLCLMAAKRLPLSDPYDIAREQLEWLIRRVKSGNATDDELARWSIIRPQLLMTFEEKPR